MCQRAFAAEGAHWSYEDATGPAKWGDLEAASNVCTVGLQQSPIDIVGRSSRKSAFAHLLSRATNYVA